MKIKFLLAVCQTDFDTFWAKFKSAVIKGNKETVASLSAFPLVFSEIALGKRRVIKNRAEFRRRYPDIFDKNYDVIACFKKEYPDKDQENPKKYVFGCAGEAYSFSYSFKLTKLGWKFYESSFMGVPD